jgi:hypothetical protein
MELIPQFLPSHIHIIIVDLRKILEVNELHVSYPRFGVQNIQNKGPIGKIFQNKDLATPFPIRNTILF